MSALALAVRDSSTMLRRNLKHAIRYPGATLGTLLVPIILLLMFVFLFGGTMAAGFGGSPRHYANICGAGHRRARDYLGIGLNRSRGEYGHHRGHR